MSTPSSIAPLPADGHTDQNDVDEDETETGHDKVETVSQADVFCVPVLVAILLDQDVVRELLDEVHDPADEGERGGQSGCHMADKEQNQRALLL